MDKKDRIAVVNLHHGLGQCRKDAWEGCASLFRREGLSLSFRQVSTLQSVYRHELTENAQLSLADLAKRIQLKNAVTSQTVTGLVQKGLMLRENVENNRRKVMISLSERGRQVAEAIATLADGYLENYFSVLTGDEFAALVKIAKKLNPRMPY